jgi:hypothetical protein
LERTLELVRCKGNDDVFDRAVHACIEMPQHTNQFTFTINPHYCNGGGEEIFPRTDLFTAISNPLGVYRNALVTFPKDEYATKWHIFRNSIPTRESKMAAAKPVLNIFPFINNIKQCSKGSVTTRNEISKATPYFRGPGI